MTGRVRRGRRTAWGVWGRSSAPPHEDDIAELVAEALG